MRIVIDSMIALMVVAVIAGGVVLYHGQRQDASDVTTVQQALERLQEQAAYHSTVQSAMAGQDTLLVHMNQAWFGDSLPVNVLLSADHPWIDLAPPGDLGTHPPDPVVSDRAQAGFWYNPTTGVFRARVQPALNEAQTLALYNEINGTSLDGFEQIPDPARAPIAHVPGTAPAQQYASMANRTWSESKPQDDEALFKLPAAEPKSDTPSQPVPEPEFVNFEDELTAVQIEREAQEANREVQAAQPASDSTAQEPQDEPPARPTLK